MNESAFIGSCPRCHSLVPERTGKCKVCGRRMQRRFQTAAEFLGAVVAVILIFAVAVLLSIFAR